MAEPLVAMLIVSSILGLTVWVFWPAKGLLSKWKHLRRGVNRTLMEDALKHLYDCEYSSLSCTVNSVSGSLGTSSDHASEIIKKLESMALVSSQKNGVLQLTPSGRAYALRVIRTHRLWERYLADETGLPEMDWHIQAENIEHRMTPAQADALAARMGNPQVDPHGDPIPSSSLEIYKLPGVSLTVLGPGDVAEIVHIEDEPNAIYVQLVAERLHVGQQLRIIAVEKDRIHFEASGEECILAPLLAAQITVRRIEREEEVQDSFRTLDSLAVGEEAMVLGISKACRGLQRRRLMDLGIVPGSSVMAELNGASGDPRAYRIRGALLALRRNQSRQIFIKSKTENLGDHDRNN